MAAENKVSEKRVIAAGETMDTDAPGEPIRSPSTAAERTRQYRRRRRCVRRPFKAELDVADAEALARRGYLAPTDRKTSEARS